MSGFYFDSLLVGELEAWVPRRVERAVSLDMMRSPSVVLGLVTLYVHRIHFGYSVLGASTSSHLVESVCAFFPFF